MCLISQNNLIKYLIIFFKLFIIYFVIIIWQLFKILSSSIFISAHWNLLPKYITLLKESQPKKAYFDAINKIK